MPTEATQERTGTLHLSRRGFLKLLVSSVVGAGALLPTIRHIGIAGSQQTNEACPDADFRSHPFVVPGVCHTALTPDTLDLQVRAQIAINALTRMAKSDSDTIIYGYSFIYRNPPVLGQPDGPIGKYYEALAMMRLVTGSQFNLQTDQRWRQAFLEWLTSSHLVMHGPDLGRHLSWMAVAVNRQHIVSTKTASTS